MSNSNPSPFANIAVTLCKTIFCLVSISCIGIAAHWLKNIYLGNLVTYQEHFNATALVNTLLMVITAFIVQYVWKEHAFTLVELAIVLIIIGFIIAGIAGGISMVNSSRLNATIQEVTQFRVATNTFRTIYGALPGDFPRAFAYWGATCGANTSGATDSCNGDGDGFVEYNVHGNAPIEDLKFWQHLTLSGIIPGTYTGTFGTPYRHQIRANIPASKLRQGAAWAPRSHGSYIDAPPGSYFDLGQLIPLHGLYSGGGVVPLEALTIDNKIDDGNPSGGTILISRGDDYWGDTTACANKHPGETSAGVQLLLNDTRASCRADFRFADK